MTHYLLPAAGRWFKANLHTHSSLSDGKLSPAELKQRYRERGYAIVAFTDHEVIIPHPELADETFLPITSVEFYTNLAVPDTDFSFTKTYHLNLYAKDPAKTTYPTYSDRYLEPQNHGTFGYVTDAQRRIDYVRDYSVEGVNRMIAAARADGFLVCYNHPVWSQQNYTDYGGLHGLWGVEVFNSGTTRDGYPDTPQPLDDLLRGGERVFPTCQDDVHGPGDLFGGFTMIRAPRLTYDAVMAALERGDFYASTGPLLEEVSLTDGRLTVRTSPAAAVVVSTERRYTAHVAAPEGDTLTEARFDIGAYLSESRRVAARPGVCSPSPYFRVTVTDRDGHRAYTRAFFADEWGTAPDGNL